MAPRRFLADIRGIRLQQGGRQMTDALDPIVQLSDALAARAAAAQGLVVALRVGHRARSAVLWDADVAIASEQVFPRAAEAEIALADGQVLKARVAGRDPGTNILALRLEHPIAAARPATAEPRLGALALAFGAAADGAPTMRLGIVRALGPAWHSLKGGLIDRRISLDFRLSSAAEGGPVLDAGGGLLGMSTAGPRGRALVIPVATITRILEAMLASGNVVRGWLGVALYPVALPEGTQADAGQHRGLRVMRVAPDGPAAKAGVQPGDILIRIGDQPAVQAREIGRGLGPDSIGRTVDIGLLRAGAPLTLTITIAARPAA
jgi:S1-C subfamily serine protease